MTEMGKPHQARRARETACGAGSSRPLIVAYTQAYAEPMQSGFSPPARYASLFRNGRNQAVRIPREFEMAGDRVRISREGARLVLEPVGAPSLLAILAELGPIDEEFPDGEAHLPPLDPPGVES